VNAQPVASRVLLRSIDLPSISPRNTDLLIYHLSSAYGGLGVEAVDNRTILLPVQGFEFLPVNRPARILVATPENSSVLLLSKAIQMHTLTGFLAST
jgi:hypothetical protein